MSVERLFWKIVSPKCSLTQLSTCHFLHRLHRGFQRVLSEWNKMLVERWIHQSFVWQNWVYDTFCISPAWVFKKLLVKGDVRSKMIFPKFHCVYELSIWLFPCRSCKGFQTLVTLRNQVLVERWFHQFCFTDLSILHIPHKTPIGFQTFQTVKQDVIVQRWFFHSILWVLSICQFPHQSLLRFSNTSNLVIEVFV